jgi:hypothetical protein
MENFPSGEFSYRFGARVCYQLIQPIQTITSVARYIEGDDNKSDL